TARDAPNKLVSAISRTSPNMRPARLPIAIILLARATPALVSSCVGVVSETAIGVATSVVGLSSDIGLLSAAFRPSIAHHFGKTRLDFAQSQRPSVANPTPSLLMLPLLLMP